MLSIDRPLASPNGIAATARGREAIFDLIEPAAYYQRPIALRNPIVFYEGHLPAFSVIALSAARARPPAGRRAAREAVRARHRSRTAPKRAVPRSGASTAWPSRDEVLRVRARVRRGRPRRAGGAEFATTASAMRARRRSTPRSSTRRCTRRRCSTCGIGCRTSRSERAGRTLRYELRRDGPLPGQSRRRYRIPAGDRDARRRPATTPLRLGQRVRRAPACTSPAFDIDVTT